MGQSCLFTIYDSPFTIHYSVTLAESERIDAIHYSFFLNYLTLKTFIPLPRDIIIYLNY